jgi:ethanolamine ammonia-lyase large subunit
MAAASANKNGDQLAGIAAESAEMRTCARYALADLPLKTFLQEALIPYEDDDVSRLIFDTHDLTAFAPVSSLTVGEFREWLLSDAATSQTLSALAPGLTPEMVAAVSKLMRNQDLIIVGKKCLNVSAFRTTLGLPGRIATRLQPNHPTDSERGILAATLDGLMMASGDALIGINPATGNIDNCYELLAMLDNLREQYAIPTQSCVLTHVTNAIRLVEQGAPTDIIFQSIAGSQKANASFGVSLSILAEAYDAAKSLNRGTVGCNAMYFETGQGSALSSEASFGVDQQTIETRAYGVARVYLPFMVNTVVGFIGPEYIDGSSQIVRAGLEDLFCGKILGLPMGCDACYTNHTSIDQNDMDVLATLLAVSGASFLIAVPGGEDVMLNYQSLSFHDILYLRSVLGLRPAPEFEPWLAKMGLGAASEGFALTDLAQPQLDHLIADVGARS